MALARFELTSGSSTGQSEDKSGAASGIEGTQGGGQIKNLSSWYNQWRSMYFTFSAHYAYKGRYIADVTLRADGTTKFGPGNRWGYFPSASLKWIVSDEPWMEKLKPTLSMLAIRPSWGRVGNQPNKEYLYTSKYGVTSKYIDMSAMYPINIRLTDLKWQMVTSYNIGVDLGLFDDKLTMAIEAYTSTTTDMLLENYRIPSNSGYATVPYHNSGKMRNIGWEFYINTRDLIRIGLPQFTDVFVDRSWLPVSIERKMMQQGRVAFQQQLISFCQGTAGKHLQVERAEPRLYGEFVIQTDSFIQHTVVVIDQR